MAFRTGLNGYCLAAWALALLAGPALAADPAANPPPQPNTPAVSAPPDHPLTPATSPDAMHGVLAGTVVALEIEQALTSKTNKDGDHFTIHLAEPISRNGVILVPAGTPGVGEVIHSRHAGWDGKPGELIIMARYLDFNGVHLPLGHLRFGVSGHDNSNVAFWTDVTIGIGFLIAGGEVQVPVGARVSARIATDVQLPPAPADAKSPVNGAS